jgi:hypothetical protein
MLHREFETSLGNLGDLYSKNKMKKNKVYNGGNSFKKKKAGVSTEIDKLKEVCFKTLLCPLQ